MIFNMEFGEKRTLKVIKKDKQNIKLSETEANLTNLSLNMVFIS